jgi:hypothetical protein
MTPEEFAHIRCVLPTYTTFLTLKETCGKAHSDGDYYPENFEARNGAVFTRVDCRIYKGNSWATYELKPVIINLTKI